MDFRKWSPEEVAYIRNYWKKQSEEEMAKVLGRTESAVRAKRRELRCSRQKTWTKEEEEYLEENWGTVSLPGLAKRLGRTVDAVRIRATRMGLGSVLCAGDFVTLNQLILVVTGGADSYSYKMTSWVKNRGLPVHTRRVNKCTWKVVYLKEFWEWAEKNRSFLDLSKMEPLALGEEPQWVAEQRRRDYRAFALQRKDPWTSAEDSRLVMLLKQQKYGYAELSKMLRRSEGAIQRRCRELGLKDRPVRADNHGADAVWTENDFERLAEGIRSGESYMLIGQEIGKSEKAVRGKVYFTYLTESTDKVRAYMGEGPWGYGAPEPTVKQGFCLSRTRTEVRKNLSVLDALLRKRMNDLGYDPYWQRFMCMNWDDIGGCSAGCTDCDSCTEFRRIKPQYCARCGETFYERAENRFCKDCRAARKRQHQRKYAVLHARGLR